MGRLSCLLTSLENLYELRVFHINSITLIHPVMNYNHQYCACLRMSNELVSVVVTAVAAESYSVSPPVRVPGADYSFLSISFSLFF